MGLRFLVSVKPILPIENRIMFMSVGIGDDTIDFSAMTIRIVLKGLQSLRNVTSYSSISERKLGINRSSRMGAAMHKIGAERAFRANH